jgi:hypothetical protein
MIDTSKCKTEEELYDAMEYVHYSTGIDDLKFKLYKLEWTQRIIQGHIDEIEKQINKYMRYIYAYKTVYPNRPWEHVSIE